MLFKRFAVCFATLALVLLAGCASNRLAEPLSQFAAVTSQATKSVSEQQGAIVRATQERATNTVVESGAPVLPYEGDCDIGLNAPRCRLRAFVAEGDAWPYSNGAFDDAVGALLSGISAYAANLSAIATAGSQSQIEVATAAVRANTLKLAGTIDTIRKQQGDPSPDLQARIAPYATPIAELVTFGLQRLVEAKRRIALRAATHQMEPVLHEAVAVFNEIASEGARLKLLALHNAFLTAEDAYLNDTKNRAKLAAYKLAAEKLDEALQTRADLFTKLDEAHHALVVALDRRDMSFQDVWPLLQEVAENATKLASIAQQLEAAGRGT